MARAMLHLVKYLEETMTDVAIHLRIAGILLLALAAAHPFFPSRDRFRTCVHVLFTCLWAYLTAVFACAL